MEHHAPSIPSQSQTESADDVVGFQKPDIRAGRPVQPVGAAGQNGFGGGGALGGGIQFHYYEGLW